MKKRKYKFKQKKLALEEGLSVKPLKIGKVPKLAVHLGLLSPKFYEIYQMCDGNVELGVIAQKLDVDKEKIRIYCDRLVSSKMLKI
jgi:hypothetical protein